MCDCGLAYLEAIYSLTEDPDTFLLACVSSRLANEVAALALALTPQREHA